jgi:hypothetical protein
MAIPAGRETARRLTQALRTTGVGARLGGSLALVEHEMTARRPRSIDLFIPAGRDPQRELGDAVRVLQRAYFPPRYRWEAEPGATPIRYGLSLFDHQGQRFAVNLVAAADLGEPVDRPGIGPVMGRLECAQRLARSLLGTEQWRVRGYVDIAHTYLNSSVEEREVLSALRGEYLKEHERTAYREALRAVAEISEIHINAISSGVDAAYIRRTLAGLADQVNAAYAVTDGRNTLLHRELNTLTRAELGAAYERMRTAGAFAWQSADHLAFAAEAAQVRLKALAEELPRANQRAEQADLAVPKTELEDDPEFQAVTRTMPDVSPSLIRQRLKDARREVANQARSEASNVAQDAETQSRVLASISRETARRRNLTTRQRSAEAAVRSGRNDAVARNAGTAPRHHVIDLANRRLAGAVIAPIGPGTGREATMAAGARRGLPTI